MSEPLHPDLEGKSKEELLAEFRKIWESPAGQELLEGVTPRIYVTFSGKPDLRQTFGPFCNVELFDDKLHVDTVDDGDRLGVEFCLAEYDLEAVGWRVNDGLEDSPVYQGMRFHTARVVE